MATQRIIHAGEVGDEARAGGLLLVDFEFFVDQREVVGKYAQAFGTTEHQVRTGLECVMHGGDHALLQFRTEIDQEVAATDQVEAGERRVLRYILLSEDTEFADSLLNLIALVDARKKAL